MTVSILVAGIGNVLYGDDGFGVEVVRRLSERPPREGVVVRDFGVRGFDLACALMDGFDAAILIDVAPRGGAPGTLSVLEPTVGAPAVDTPDGHGLHPANALRLIEAMGGTAPPLRLVVCEPRVFGDAEDVIMGLSPEVAAAVSGAMVLVDALLETFAEPGHA